MLRGPAPESVVRPVADVSLGAPAEAPYSAAAAVPALGKVPKDMSGFEGSEHLLGKECKLCVDSLCFTIAKKREREVEKRE